MWKGPKRETQGQFGTCGNFDYTSRNLNIILETYTSKRFRTFTYIIIDFDGAFPYNLKNLHANYPCAGTFTYLRDIRMVYEKIPCLSRGLSWITFLSCFSWKFARSVEIRVKVVSWEPHPSRPGDFCVLLTLALHLQVIGTAKLYSLRNGESYGNIGDYWQKWSVWAHNVHVWGLLHHYVGVI